MPKHRGRYRAPWRRSKLPDPPADLPAGEAPATVVPGNVTALNAPLVEQLKELLALAETGALLNMHMAGRLANGDIMTVYQPAPGGTQEERMLLLARQFLAFMRTWIEANFVTPK